MRGFQKIGQDIAKILQELSDIVCYPDISFCICGGGRELTIFELIRKGKG